MANKNGRETTTEHIAYWWDIETPAGHHERLWVTDREVARIATEALTAAGYRCTSRRGPGEEGTARIRVTR